MKRIKGILFDKDGTIIDFNSTWIPAADILVDEILDEINCPSRDRIKVELFKSVGIVNGRVLPNGIYAGGTTGEMAEKYFKVLNRNGIDCGDCEEFIDNVINKVNKIMQENRVNLVPVGDLRRIFTRLREKNIYIGISTADTCTSTKSCLDKLGVYDCFDFIGCDNGIFKCKPHPDMLHEFCRVCGIEPDEVAVVGDTIIDMIFAREGKAGLAIGVLTGTATMEDLKDSSDFIFQSIENLFNEDGRLVWENIC